MADLYGYISNTEEKPKNSIFRGLARFLMPQQAENWLLGSKEDENFLNKWSDSEIPTYEEIQNNYKNGIYSQKDVEDYTNLRNKFDTLSANREYTDVRNQNIGQGVVDIGTGLIGGGGALATKTGINLLKPYLGRKIAQTVTQGAVGGGLGGLAHGVGTGIVQEEVNPLTQGLYEGAIGTGFGTVGGLGLGKIAKGVDGYKLVHHKPFEKMNKFERKEFKKQGKKYYKEYLLGTSIKKDGYGKIYFNSNNAGKNSIWGMSNLPNVKNQIKKTTTKTTTKDKENKNLFDHLFYKDKERLIDNEIELFKDGTKNYKMSKIMESNESSGTYPEAVQAPSNNSITDNNINLNSLGENLYILNKEAKKYRDLGRIISDTFDYTDNARYGEMGQKEVDLINEKLNLPENVFFDFYKSPNGELSNSLQLYQKTTEGNLPYDYYKWQDKTRSVKNKIEDLNKEYRLLDKRKKKQKIDLENKIKEEQQNLLKEQEKTNLYKLLTKDAQDFKRKIDEGTSKNNNIIQDKSNELYNIKDEVINKINPEIIEYHKFGDGKIRPLYKIGNYTFHGNKDYFNELTPGQRNNIKEIKNLIDSENKLNKDVSVNEAINNINSQLGTTYKFNPKLFSYLLAALGIKEISNNKML